MDVLVVWKDSTCNVVCSNELKNVKRNEPITVGSEVKMFFRKKWYRGTVTHTEYNTESDSEDIPLAELAKKLQTNSTPPEELTEEHDVNNIQGVDLGLDNKLVSGSVSTYYEDDNRQLCDGNDKAVSDVLDNEDDISVFTGSDSLDDIPLVEIAKHKQGNSNRDCR